MSSISENHSCSYCKKEFKTKYILKAHLDRSKRCMEKRGEQPSSEFICHKCDFVFMIKNDLTRHLSLCKKTKNDATSLLIEQLKQQIKEKDNIIKQKDETIKEKDQIIKDLAEKAINNAKPTINNNHTNNTTNNTINNLQIMSDDHIKAQAKNLTIDHIKRGALGYSEYFLEYPLKERVACTDYARRKIKYKNENGDIVTDPEMTNLAERLFQSIKDRNKELTIQYTRELTDKYKDEKGAIEISHFMDLATKFSEQDLEVFKMFNGDKNDFFHDILRHICSKTLV